MAIWHRHTSPQATHTSSAVVAEHLREPNWAHLPVLQRAVTPIEPVAPRDSFVAGLASHQNPEFLAPLAHVIDPDGPSGRISGLISAAPAQPAAPAVQRVPDGETRVLKRWAPRLRGVPTISRAAEESAPDPQPAPPLELLDAVPAPTVPDEIAVAAAADPVASTPEPTATAAPGSEPVDTPRTAPLLADSANAAPVASSPPVVPVQRSAADAPTQPDPQRSQPMAQHSQPVAQQSQPVVQRSQPMAQRTADAPVDETLHAQRSTQLPVVRPTPVQRASAPTLAGPPAPTGSAPMPPLTTAPAPPPLDRVLPVVSAPVSAQAEPAPAALARGEVPVVSRSVDEHQPAPLRSVPVDATLPHPTPGEPAATMPTRAHESALPVAQRHPDHSGTELPAGEDEFVQRSVASPEPEHDGIAIAPAPDQPVVREIAEPAPLHVLDIAAPATAGTSPEAPIGAEASTLGMPVVNTAATSIPAVQRSVGSDVRDAPVQRKGGFGAPLQSTPAPQQSTPQSTPQQPAAHGDPAVTVQQWSVARGIPALRRADPGASSAAPSTAPVLAQRQAMSDFAAADELPAVAEPARSRGGFGAPLTAPPQTAHTSVRHVQQMHHVQRAAQPTSPLAALPPVVRRAIAPAAAPGHDAGSAAIEAGVAQRDADGSVVFDTAPEYSLQRAPDDAPAPAAEPAPAAAPPPAAAAGPAGAAGAAGAAGGNIEDLVRRLYDPLAARLKAELWLDRERAGLVTDLRR